MVKVATKGQKEIYNENINTIRFYTIGTLASAGAYLLIWSFVWQNSWNGWVSFVVSLLMQLGCLLLFKTMAKAVVDQKGHVIDAGVDINDPTGYGEQMKDVLILSIISQVIALYSNYGFLLLLAIPGALIYKFVFSMFIPWITAGSDAPETDVDDKKLRKRERREKIQFRH